MLSKALQRVVDEVNRGTARDRQVKVGPSELGDMCELCLGEKLLASYEQQKREPQKTALAPWIGTGGHLLLEHTLLDLQDEVSSYDYSDPFGLGHNIEPTEEERKFLKRWGYVTSVQPETKVVVGEIRGLGPIKGSADRFDTEEGHVIDYKFVSKAKARQYRMAYTVKENGEVEFDKYSKIVDTIKQYYAQQMLYAKGKEDEGFDVHNTSLALLPRDATTESFEDALVELVFPYSRTYAEKILERASQILEWVLENDVSKLESADSCYYCNRVRYTGQFDLTL